MAESIQKPDLEKEKKKKSKNHEWMIHRGRLKKITFKHIKVFWILLRIKKINLNYTKMLLLNYWQKLTNVWDTTI